MPRKQTRSLQEVAADLRQLPLFLELLPHLRHVASSAVSQAISTSADASRDRLVSLLAKAEAHADLYRLLSGDDDANLVS